MTELRKGGLKIELADMISSSTLDDIAETCVLVAPDSDEDPKPFSLLKDSAATQRFKMDKTVEDAYPVTPLQEGLLAASLGGNDDYFYQRTWNLNGVDIERLHQATQIVFENSNILRTTFIPQGKSYVQLVMNDMSLPWSTHTVSLARYKQVDKEAGITIGQPLFRIAVVQEKYFVVTMHHSLFDFWSHRFLYQDIAAMYYEHEMVQRPAFSRFVKHLLDTDHSESEDFWRHYLADANRTMLNHAATDGTVSRNKDLAIGLGKTAKALGITMGM